MEGQKIPTHLRVTNAKKWTNEGILSIPAMGFARLCFLFLLSFLVFATTERTHVSDITRRHP